MEEYGMHILISGYVTEEQQARTGDILQLIIEQSFGQYEEMCLDKSKLEFMPFNAKKLTDKIAKSKNWGFQLRSGVTDEYVRGTLNLNFFLRTNDIKLDISLADTAAHFPGDIRQKIKNFIFNALPLFPGLGKGYVSVTGYDYDTFREENKMEPLNSCFLSSVFWIHFLGKPEYDYCGYTKDELLQTPAFQTREFPNDIVFIQTVEDPYFWNDTAAVESVKKINTYLVSKAFK